MKRIFNIWPSCILLVTLLVTQQTAYAEVWGFVDKAGVAHIASSKLDERYELYFRAGESFDTTQGMPSGNSAMGVAPAEPSRGLKLIELIKASPKYRPLQTQLFDAAKAHGLDQELLQALIATESGFDASAVSPKGAVGLMQLMPDTAARYGVRADKKMSAKKKLFNPKTNLQAGSRYLRDLLKLFPGQLQLALAAYNAGEGAVQRAGNKIPKYKETQNYVQTVMALYTTLKPPVSAPSKQAPTRVRMELLGGASQRGNMITQLDARALMPPLPPVSKTETD